MKKSIRRKLALSALSVGVALLSVTATTYAWFTTNTTATATGVQGTATSIDTSLLIGVSDTENAPTTWGANLTLAAQTNLALKPLQFKQTGQYQDLAEHAAVYTASQKDYASYTIWFKVTDLAPNQTRYVSLTMKDLNASLSNSLTQGNQVLVADAAAETGEPLAVPASYRAGQTIENIKLIDSLALDVTGMTKSGSDNDTAVTYVTGSGAISTNHIFKYTADVATDYDALIYYNNVMGTSLNRSNDPAATIYSSTALWDGSAGNKINLVTVANNSSSDYKDVVFKLTFNVFLNGWDKDNFNAVASKQFANSFEFKIDSQA